MPKGKFTRPLGSKRKKLSDPTGKANEEFRKMGAAGYKPDEMRMRERAKGTAMNKGYVSDKGKVGKSPMRPMQRRGRKV